MRLIISALFISLIKKINGFFNSLNKTFKYFLIVSFTVFSTPANAADIVINSVLSATQFFTEDNQAINVISGGWHIC